MNGRPLILCCWPGLAHLWLRGDWSSLFVAIVFSLMLNLALVSTFVWPALLDPSFTLVAWPLIICVWITSAWLSYRLLGRDSVESDTVEDDQDSLFIQAQTQYLKGDWKQAEVLLLRQLNSHVRDIEARLLLATIFRRMGRMRKAAQQLDALGRLDASIQWKLEIGRERELVNNSINNLRAANHNEHDSYHEKYINDESTPELVTSAIEAGAIRLGESAQQTVELLDEQQQRQNLSPDQNDIELPDNSTKRKAS